MRLLLTLAILSLCSISSAFASKDRYVPPHFVTVEFGKDQNIEFELEDRKLVSIRVHIAGATIDVPMKDCLKLHDIRYDTATIVYAGRLSKPDPGGYFEIQFEVGPESTRAFGELRVVKLRFHHGYEDAVVSTRVADGWETSQL